MVSSHHHYPKQPRNPFSTRHHPAPVNSSYRILNLICVTLAVGLTLIAYLLWANPPVGKPGMLSPDQEEKSAPRNIGGLRSQSKLHAAATESVVTDSKLVEKNSDAATLWEEEGGNHESYDDDPGADPEDEVTPNARIGEAKEKVKQEYEQIHASVQDHVFGQKNDSTESEVHTESTPVVITKAESTETVRTVEIRAEQAEDKNGKSIEIDSAKEQETSVEDRKEQPDIAVRAGQIPALGTAAATE